MHLHIVFARRTKHINYFSHDILVLGIGPLGYFHHGLITRFAAFKLTFRHEDVVYVQVFGRYKERHIAFNPQFTQHLVFGAFQNFDNQRLLDMSFAARHQLHANTVSVKRRLGVSLTYEDGQ